MYIKSVIIDGFKSYGRRTEVYGFDNEFTAITGLNGTGKSNILDSICFVLGITNLGQVRAASYQELVFKSGQAGVTKATVTLVFDNSDPNQCPLGYEKCREISVTRQIVIGGKNKYLINGKNVPNKKVSDLFCSVQLNVNNPNFLIMQGRITKVLNMKPHEILSMIEEAAGTSMYESKKEATTKLIEKKDAKVRETNTLLAEEVEPKLEKLRQERSAYFDFQKVCRDIEYLTRIHISFKYLKQRDALKETEEQIQIITNNIDQNKQKIIENENEIKELEKSAEETQQKMDIESGGSLKDLENELTQLSSKEAKATGTIKASKSALEQEEKNVKSLAKSIKDDEDALAKKEIQMEKMQSQFKHIKEASENDAKLYDEAQKTFEAVSQGLSTNEDGEASSLQDQLITAKQHASEAQTTLKTSDMELRHSRNLLNQKKSENQTNDASYLKDKNMYDKINSEIKRMTDQLSKISYQEGSLEMLQERKSILVQEIRQFKQQLDRKNAYRYEMQYRDPVANFDRSKVRGMVGKLFEVRDEKNLLALTMCAGGSLYSQVTDDDVTSKLILQKGQLQSRVTIIPINKISSRSIHPNVVNIAQNLVGKENVTSALSLIDFDLYYEPVMKFVFGHTLISRDLDIAKKVTYHPEIMCRSVTLDGDVVDPEGTLSGGSRPSGGSVLQELREIKLLEDEIRIRKIEHQEIEQKLSSIEDTARKYNSAKESIELRQHELSACSERLSKTTFQQHQEEIDQLKKKIDDLENDSKEAREKLQSANIKMKNIEAKLVDAKGFRERELKTAANTMKNMKKKSEESRANWTKHEQNFETLRMEIEDLQKGIENSKKQKQDMTEKLESLKLKLEELVLGSADILSQVAEKKREIQEQKSKINSQNKELRQLLHKKDKLGKNNQEMVLDIKKKENEVIKVKSDNSDGYSRIKDLEKTYTWIKEDREFFGIKNTRYDYSKEDPVEAGRKLSKMREQKAKMERNINLKAMMLLDREEEQYKETMRRKKIVEEDKEKIQRIIVKMDEKKKEKIDKAWKVVDENFSNIFSTLLTGAQSRLKPITAGNSLQGLEICVGFNGFWKESLSELSGGQRSLVALSLVLAMLKFSPAPLYILDEVDAALDMSHTQNIGSMLKTHFTNSQFIIVSLKDGMFNNANVLFRTKFEEGVSAVTRTVNKKVGRK